MIPSDVLSQHLWFNTFTKIENKIINCIEFSDNQMNHVTKAISFIETTN